MSIASSNGSEGRHGSITTTSRSPPMMELSMDPNDLVWDETEYKLKFVLDNPNFILPQVVRIHQGHMIDEDDSLASGQVLTIHGKKKIENLCGKDIYGKELNVPLTCPFKLRVLSLASPRRFAGVKELINNEQSPSHVLFEKESKKQEDESLLIDFSSSNTTDTHVDNRGGSMVLAPDVVLEIKDKVFNSDGDVIGINCTIDTGNETDNKTRSVTLPMSLVGCFVETLSRKQLQKRHLVSNLIKDLPLPLNVQFPSTAERGSAYGPQLGVITLEKKKSISSVLATTIIDNVRHALTFSAERPVTVQVATGIKKNIRFPSSSSSINTTSHVDLKRFDYCSPSDPYSGITLQTFDDLCTPMVRRRGSSQVSSRSHPITSGNKDNGYMSSRYSSTSSVATTSDFTNNNNHNHRSQSNSSHKMNNNKGNNKGKDISKNIENFFKFKSLRKSVSSKLGRGDRNNGSQNLESAKRSPNSVDFEETRSFIQSDDGNSSADLFSIAPTSNGSDSTCNESSYSRISECIDSISIHQTETPGRRRRHMRKGSGDSGICLSGRKHHPRSRSLSRSRSRMSPDAPSSNRSDTIDTFSEWSLPMNTSKDSPSSGRKTYSSQGGASTSSCLWGVEANTIDIEETELIKPKQAISSSSLVVPEGDVISEIDFVSKNNSLNSATNNTHQKSVVPASPLTSRQKESMSEIWELTEDGVCRILDQLKFTDFKDAFIQNQVNGELLLELEVEDLVNDLKLSLFQARKIAKYIKGWRPEPEDHQVVETSRRNSLNPRDWSENDVLLHMTTINLSEFGQFCIKNQVNGDLLMDIMDKDTLNSLKNDHKLNITNLESKKLLNFVVKGWRPDISPKKSALL